MAKIPIPAIAENAGPDVAQLFDVLFRNATDCVLFTRTDGTVLRANAAACTALARTEEQIRREGRDGLLVADENARRMVAERARAGTSSGELSFRRLDGSTFVAEVTSTIIQGAGAQEYSYVIFRDATERHRVEAESKEREARLRAYFECPAVGIALTSPEKRWIEVNDELCSMLGYSRDELSGMTWVEVTHPDDVAGNLRLFDQLVAGQRESYTMDKRFIRKDGTPFWVLLSVSCVRRADRSVKHVVSIYVDIEKRKLAEEALRESEHWLRISQEITGIGHYVFDIQKNHWTSSTMLNGVFGIDESFPRTAGDWLRIVHPDDRAKMEDYLAELLARWSRFDREYRVVDQSSGEVRWVHGLGELQRAPDGKPIRLVGTIRDVTALRRAEAEQVALQERLALSSRLAAMGTLVAGVAHEINNPLTADLAGQGLALESARKARMLRKQGSRLGLKAEIALLDEVIEGLEDAQEGAQRVARIVRDMAAFGNPNPTRTRVKLVQIVDAALGGMPALVAQAANVRVESRDSPDVMAAAGQIAQVVVNLVTNAAKATREGTRGEIVIRVGPGSQGMARLEVTDHGTGIPAAILGRILRSVLHDPPTRLG